MIELFDKKHLKYKKYFGIALISLSILFLIFLFWGFFIAPKAKAISPENSLKKIEVNFNKPVNRNKISASISPDTPGVWQYEGQILGSHLFTKLVFYPDSYLTPEQHYTVNINSISSILRFTPNNNFVLKFNAQSLPKIKATSIENGQKDVRIDLPIIVELDKPAENMVDYDFVFSPEVDYKKTYMKEKHQYVLELRTMLRQSTTYSMTAKRNLIGSTEGDKAEVKDNFTINFTTKGPPGVKSFSPNGNNVFVDTKEISIIFDQDMDQSVMPSHVFFSPTLNGAWNWSQKEHQLTYKLNENLKYNIKYNIHINKGITGEGSSYIPDDIDLTFNTIGYATVTSTTPTNNATSVSAKEIALHFNQEVDHSSAEKAFYIEPVTSGTFSWDGNAMTFTASSLNSDTSYKFGVKSGISSIHGLASIDAYNFSFSTKTSETILNIPLDYQDKPLSCEAASLKMALRYKGANVTENDIMNIVGFDPTIRNGNVWGDPYTAFVGDINGRQDTTGYGVYWDPIAKAANNWRKATAFTGWSAQQIAEQISAGNPVVIWGVAGHSIARDDWQTPSGKKIIAWHGEHARTLIGFNGSVSNPTSFIINDPIFGRITWTKSQLESNWSSFGNAGVVVY